MTVSSATRVPATMFVRCAILAIMAIVGCVPAVRPPPDEPHGRFAVVFTNTSDKLVYALLGVQPDFDEDNILTWAVPVAPTSWDSLILDCNVERVVPLGVLVADLANPSDPLNVGLDELPFERGGEFDCGSVIAFQIEQDPRGLANRPVRTRTRTVNDPATLAEDSLGPPGARNGFIFVEASAPPGTRAKLNISWEGEGARVFQSAIEFSGRESRFGFLLNCPIERFTLGRLDDASASVGTVTESGETIELEASPPTGQVSCGGTIEIHLTQSDASPSGFALTTDFTSGASGQSSVMYDDLRVLLDEEGLYERPSSILSLLPPSIVTGGNP